MTPALDKLIEAFALLPGIGKRTAQRMSIHLLQRDRAAMHTLSTALAEAAERVRRCAVCRTFSDAEICSVCTDSSRDKSLLCVVESPADQIAIEQQGEYKGHYFVLHGYLSPLDGIGPEQLGLDQMQKRCAEVQEVILATNTTVEGEATAYYLAELLSPLQMRLTRIASGVPLGGEIEYLDAGTLGMALASRRPFSL